MAIDAIAPDLDGASLRIGIVQARFNEWAGQALAAACLKQLRELGVDDDDITHVTVPGALEVPMALARLAQTDDFDALIAVGCVIRGETYHFEIVAGESARGLMDLAVAKRLCIGNGILTVEDEDQAWARARVSEGDKGGGAARAALTMVSLRQQLLAGKR